MFGIRSTKLRLYLHFFKGLLPAILLLNLITLNRAFSATSHTFRGQRRLLRENQNPCDFPIGSWTMRPQPTTRGRAWRRTALYDNPDPNESTNTNENNQTGNAGNENEKNQRSENKNIQNKSASLFQLNFNVDPFLLVPDLLGVAVACEFLGLLDAVQEPGFLQNGGLLQSIGGIPTTLPLLVTRFSTNSVFWITSCFGISAIINDSKSNTKDTSNAMASGQSAVGYALRIGAVFCILRIVLTLVVAAVATAGATGWDLSSAATVDALLAVLRECYVVVLVTATTRYVVQALYY
jgi:hypothetical protein